MEQVVLAHFVKLHIYKYRLFESNSTNTMYEIDMLPLLFLPK